MQQGATAVFVFIGSGAWRNIILPHKIDKVIAKSMVHYSVPLMPNSISWWINNSSDRYIMKINMDFVFFAAVNIVPRKALIVLKMLANKRAGTNTHAV